MPDYTIVDAISLTREIRDYVHDEDNPRNIDPVSAIRDLADRNTDKIYSAIKNTPDDHLVFGTTYEPKKTEAIKLNSGLLVAVYNHPEEIEKRANELVSCLEKLK